MVPGRIASAPFIALFQQLRSRSARSSALVRSTQSENAKFGPPECSERVFEIARSQRIGLILDGFKEFILHSICSKIPVVFVLFYLRVLFVLPKVVFCQGTLTFIIFFVILQRFFGLRFSHALCTTFLQGIKITQKLRLCC